MAELIQMKTSRTNSTRAYTTPPSPSKSTSFLACFGFSKKISSSKPRRSKSPPSPLIEKETNYIRSSHHHHDDHHHEENKNKIKSGTRTWYLISWSSWRFHANKSATKTVPIDTSSTVTEKREPSQSKSRSKSSVKIVTNSEREVLPATTDGKLPGGLTQREPPISDLHTRHTLKPQQPQANTINLENRRHMESPPEDDTYRKRLSICRKVDSIRTSKPGSQVPEEIKKPESRNSTPRTAGTAVMSHSLSFPTQERQSARTGNNPSAQTNNKHSSWSTTTVSNKATSKNNKAAGETLSIKTSNNKKLDPLVGMSLIMVTLIIMLLWGRLCAILCTSAWFYFLSSLRSPTATTTSDHESNSGMNPKDLDLDLNSEEYKKKVVLEGFLQRNHRHSIL